MSSSRRPALLQRLDVVADRARLFLVVPYAEHGDALPMASSVNSVLPSRPLLCAMRPEAAARMWPVER